MELTRIPNHRNALLYRDTLFKALREDGVTFSAEVEEHYDDQYSEVVVTVSDNDYDKAFSIMKKVIRRGPPK